LEWNAKSFLPLLADVAADHAERVLAPRAFSGQGARGHRSRRPAAARQIEMSATWAMGKALNELMARHGQTLPSPAAVPLSPPTATPMLLSGMASTLDTDIEHVAFAPFAFELPANVPLHFDHSGEVAGRIELLAHSDSGELMIQAYVDHEMARRCNAFSISGDVLDYSLHDTGSPSFYARVKRVRLREISLVPNPVNNKARVLKRELPSPASKFVAGTLERHDLMIRRVKLFQKQLRILEETIA